MKKQLNENFTSLIRTSIYPQGYKSDHAAKFNVFFSQCWSFLSARDNFFFQISSCKHAYLPQFTKQQIKRMWLTLGKIYKVWRQSIGKSVLTFSYLTKDMIIIIIIIVIVIIIIRVNNNNNNNNKKYIKYLNLFIYSKKRPKIRLGAMKRCIKKKKIETFIA